jgi:hypothetical protein
VRVRLAVLVQRVNRARPSTLNSRRRSRLIIVHFK